MHGLHHAVHLEPRPQGPQPGFLTYQSDNSSTWVPPCLVKGNFSLGGLKTLLDCSLEDWVSES